MVLAAQIGKRVCSYIDGRSIKTDAASVFPCIGFGAVYSKAHWCSRLYLADYRGSFYERMTEILTRSASVNGLSEKTRIFIGIGFAVGGVLLFSFTEVIAKYLGKLGYPALQLVFLRNLFSLIPTLLVIWRLDKFRNLELKSTKSYIIRAVLGAGSLWCFFYALPRMLLADVAALSFAAPIFTSMLAPLMLKEQSNAKRWITVVVGFVGVLIIVQPTAQIFENATSLLVLIAALGGSLSILITRRLGRTERFGTMLFYVSFFTLIFSALMLPFGAWRSDIPISDLMLIMLLGLISGGAGILIVISYRLAPAGVVAPFDYLAIIFAMALGFFIFGEWPGIWTLVGSSLVIGCGLYIIYEQSRAADTAIDSIIQPESD